MTPRQFKTGLEPRAPRRLGQPGLRRPATSPHYIRPSRIAGVSRRSGTAAGRLQGPLTGPDSGFQPGRPSRPRPQRPAKWAPGTGGGKGQWILSRGGSTGGGAAQAAVGPPTRRRSRGDTVCATVFATLAQAKRPSIKRWLCHRGRAQSVSLSGPLRRDCGDDVRSRSGGAAAPLFVFSGLLAAPAFAVEGCCKRRNSFSPSPSAGALSSAARRQCT